MLKSWKYSIAFSVLKHLHRNWVTGKWMSSMWTYHTDEWRRDGPTHLPEHEWIVANHVFDAIIEAIYSECPWNSNAFKEDQEQQAEATDSIWIEDLEHIHSTLEHVFKYKPLICRRDQQCMIRHTQALWKVLCVVAEGEATHRPWQW